MPGLLFTYEGIPLKCLISLVEAMSEGYEACILETRLTRLLNLTLRHLHHDEKGILA